MRDLALATLFAGAILVVTLMWPEAWHPFLWALAAVLVVGGLILMYLSREPSDARILRRIDENSVVPGDFVAPPTFRH